jgi:hypothetical protein
MVYYTKYGKRIKNLKEKQKIKDDDEVPKVEVPKIRKIGHYESIAYLGDNILYDLGTARIGNIFTEHFVEILVILIGLSACSVAVYIALISRFALATKHNFVIMTLRGNFNIVKVLVSVFSEIFVTVTHLMIVSSVVYTIIYGICWYFKAYNPTVLSKLNTIKTTLMKILTRKNMMFFFVFGKFYSGCFALVTMGKMQYWEAAVINIFLYPITVSAYLFFRYSLCRDCTLNGRLTFDVANSNPFMAAPKEQVASEDWNGKYIPVNDPRDVKFRNMECYENFRVRRQYRYKGWYLNNYYDGRRRLNVCPALVNTLCLHYTSSESIRQSGRMYISRSGGLYAIRSEEVDVIEDTILMACFLKDNARMMTPENFC